MAINANDYEGANEGFEDICFDRCICIEIIKETFYPGIQQVIERIAGTSLSL